MEGLMAGLRPELGNIGDTSKPEARRVWIPGLEALGRESGRARDWNPMFWRICTAAAGCSRSRYRQVTITMYLNIDHTEYFRPPMRLCRPALGDWGFRRLCLKGCRCGAFFWCWSTLEPY